MARTKTPTAEDISKELAQLGEQEATLTARQREIEVQNGEKEDRALVNEYVTNQLKLNSIPHARERLQDQLTETQQQALLAKLLVLERQEKEKQTALDAQRQRIEELEEQLDHERELLKKANYDLVARCQSRQRDIRQELISEWNMPHQKIDERLRALRNGKSG